MRRDGASYREIAAAFGNTKDVLLPASEWRDSAARSAAVRLVRDAERMTNRDYLSLLRIR